MVEHPRLFHALHSFDVFTVSRCHHVIVTLQLNYNAIRMVVANVAEEAVPNINYVQVGHVLYFFYSSCW